MTKQNDAWVNRLQDLDREALIDLCDGNFDELLNPREINFVIYDFTSDEQINKVRHYLEENGYKVSVTEDVNQKAFQAYTVEAQLSNFVITEESYRQATDTIRRIANENDVYYDGWYASK